MLCAIAIAQGPVHAGQTVAGAAANQQGCAADTRVAEAPTALSELQSESAWSLTRGGGVTVAIVDSGVARNPHLDGVISGGVNLVPDGTDPAGRTDTFGHGTAIAGQIAAQLIDRSGVQGLAPDARIMPVRVFSGTSDQEMEAGFGPSTARIAEGIRYAVDHGAKIINVSMSTRYADPSLADAVSHAADRGSLVVSTAGNRDSSFSVEESESDGRRYPAGFPGVIGVAATGVTGVVTESSIHGPHVSVSAPGQFVATSSNLGMDCVYSDDAPATSYAAAYVSAAAALVASAHPDENPAQWTYRLEATAVRPDPDRRDDWAGWGVVQPYDAIALVPGSGMRGPVSPFGQATSSPPVAAQEGSVTVTADPGADAEAIRIGIGVGIIGLVVLIALGTLGVYSTRRGEALSPRPQHIGPGLYGDRRET